MPLTIRYAARRGSMSPEPARIYRGQPQGAASAATLLETAFPFAELSQVARADRRGRDPAYGAHRWWARRPRSLIRGVLVAAALPSEVDVAAFWSAYSSDGVPLEGLRVHDIFVGGGSTLIEASRLGAAPSGSDVDPLAVEIVRHALSPPPASEVERVGSQLIDQLRSEYGHLYPVIRDGWTPLHYFYLRRVSCPECNSDGILHRDLVVARDMGKVGAVVRDHEVTAFCPVCLHVHHLGGRATSLDCCGDTHPLSRGTFKHQKYECSTCGRRSDHGALQTGRAELVLLAVEETHLESRRAIRAPTIAELECQQEAQILLASAAADFQLPEVRFQEHRSDPRPVSYGLERPRDLFSPRQQVVLGRAFGLISVWKTTEEVRRAVRLGLSNALATNNILCGYATDYGRLSPLFGVRSYCIPALAVELNPLQLDGGRGTLRRCLDRSVRSATVDVARYVWDADAGAPRRVILPDRPSRDVDTARVECRPASTLSLSLTGTVDICFFDPPYFNYIPYDELSEFYRAWMPVAALSGTPVLPSGDRPVESFAQSLAACMRSALSALKPGRPFSFTYHSTDQRAWEAVGRAIDIADVRVTALWPIYSDGHMGHHSHAGNCEWDVLIVCRPTSQCAIAAGPWSVESWVAAVAPIEVGDADRENFRLAIEMAACRAGTACTVRVEE